MSGENSKQKVAVIGAGIAGLCSLKVSLVISNCLLSHIKVNKELCNVLHKCILLLKYQHNLKFISEIFFKRAISSALKNKI
jgi:hypothetical protein